MRRELRIIRGRECSPLGGGEMPEVGSVEFNRGWTLNELSDLVREGRNLALCARTSIGLTFDRDPTMMCDLSGRVDLFENCLCGELAAPAHPSAPSRDLTTHVGTSFQMKIHINKRLAYGQIELFLCLNTYG